MLLLYSMKHSKVNTTLWLRLICVQMMIIRYKLGSSFVISTCSFLCVLFNPKGYNTSRLVYTFPIQGLLLMIPDLKLLLAGYELSCRSCVLSNLFFILNSSPIQSIHLCCCLIQKVTIQLELLLVMISFLCLCTVVTVD